MPILLGICGNLVDEPISKATGVAVPMIVEYPVSGSELDDSIPSSAHGCGVRMKFPLLEKGKGKRECKSGRSIGGEC